jgi:uncharacterized protein (TIGR02271 family)
MIDESQLSTVGRATVYGRDGEKIGRVGQIYLDDQTGRPEWVSVNTGMFGLKESLVPLRDATLSDDRLDVAYDKATIKDAPNVDADRHLDESEEDELYRYYGLSGDRDVAGAAYTGTGTDKSTLTGTDESTLTGTDETAAGSGREWTAPEETDAPVGRGTTDWTAATGAVTGSAATTDRSAAPASATTGSADRQPGTSSSATTDDAMTRSEEELRVGREKVERGRARLRKYVTTEEQTVTVPVTREEVRVEREPITEGNRSAAMSGPAISEDEHEVVLHEDRPVVSTEARPVERVRLEKETVTDEERVSGEVRKEHIDVDDEPGSRRP